MAHFSIIDDCSARQLATFAELAEEIRFLEWGDRTRPSFLPRYTGYPFRGEATCVLGYEVSQEKSSLHQSTDHKQGIPNLQYQESRIKNQEFIIASECYRSADPPPVHLLLLYIPLSPLKRHKQEVNNWSLAWQLLRRCDCVRFSSVSRGPQHLTLTSIGVASPLSYSLWSEILC